MSGYKPTYGRVSHYGLIAYASSLDCVGAIARTAEDLALWLDCASDQDGADATSRGGAEPTLDGLDERADLHGLRVGVPTELNGAGIDDEVVGVTTAAVDQLRALGADTRLPEALRDPDRLWDLARRDKKATRGDVPMCVPVALGAGELVSLTRASLEQALRANAVRRNHVRTAAAASDCKIRSDHRGQQTRRRHDLRRQRYPRARSLATLRSLCAGSNCRWRRALAASVCA